MNRWMVVGLMMLALCVAGMAQEATLATETKAAYDQSVVAMSESLGPDKARQLVLKLISLAVGPAPEGTAQMVHLQQSMAVMEQKPQLFLDALKPYDGFTAEQILDE